MPSSHPTCFGELLRKLRLERGFGLREFALIIGDYPSNLSAIEHGERDPWKRSDKLREIASALGLTEKSEVWDQFFLLAKSDPNLSSRMKKAISSPLALKATRTLARKKLTPDKIKKLEEFLKDL